MNHVIGKFSHDFKNVSYCRRCGQINPYPDGICLSDKLTLEQLREEIKKENIEASLHFDQLEKIIENFKKNQF